MKFLGFRLAESKDPEFGRKAIKQAKKDNGDIKQVRKEILRTKAVASPFKYFKRRVGAWLMRSPVEIDKVPEHAGWVQLLPQRSDLIERIVELGRQIHDRRKNSPAVVDKIYGRSKDGKKTHLINMLREQDLLDHPEFIEFALSDQILSLATDYLGSIPKLQNFQMWWTTTNQSTYSSQLFHVDEIDDRQLKFFIHIWDVTDENGPFHFIPAAISERVRNDLSHSSGRLTDEEVLSCCDGNDLIKITGAAGSVTGIDTCRCLHYGSRAREAERLVIMFHFTPFAEIYESTDTAITNRVREKYAIDGIRSLVLDHSR